MAYKIIKQYRLYGFDYSQNGAYFITIITKNRKHFFGEIADKEITLSPIGEFVKANFTDISEKFSRIKIADHVIMPDHLHLIVSIENDKEKPYEFAEGLRPLLKGSVSAFINHFKGYIKRWCNDNNFSGFAWQPRFHDRVIRNEKEYDAISNYIRKCD